MMWAWCPSGWTRSTRVLLQLPAARVVVAAEGDAVLRVCSVRVRTVPPDDLDKIPGGVPRPPVVTIMGWARRAELFCATVDIHVLNIQAR